MRRGASLSSHTASAAAFGVWAFVGPEPPLANALLIAVAVLIIAAAAMSLSSASVIANALRLRAKQPV